MTPNRFRARHPHPTPPAPVKSGHQRRSTITDLEAGVRTLEVPQLGHSLVCEHAATHILGPASMAVVMLCRHNAHLVEQAIRARYLDDVEVSTDGDVLTITLRTARTGERGRR
ncbi:hypothetical protein [Nocardia vaccinii]|uniref:hypothetical protein n=1 Tax=Nocardia vaccinii TaxID=1822 RepID=UPI0012F47C2C|nr:hypothetical protein [Nocardia vaccinii]